MSPVSDSCSTPSGKESFAPTSSSRRSKTMPTDGPAAKFLYAIIKQLDLKGVDWPLVASQLDISNGHAARMRYHRFRNQMEGINPTQRKRTVNNKTSSKSSKNPLKAGLQRARTPEPTSPIKNEPCPSSHSPYGANPPNPFIKNKQSYESTNFSSFVKTEQPYMQHTPRLSQIQQYASPMAPASYLHSYSSAFMPATPAPYDQMNLAPELRISSYIPSSMPPYPPVPETFTHQYPSSVAWTPVKVEPRASPVEQKDYIEIAHARVKDEAMGDSMFHTG
ncbi:uncharacterized protein BDV17DRAFT_262145 [Aspergillus undulatus]|uniref:uncharacterized protein n=1 Tax=Aspergillus undulatus TaxID=1810928 RepID=UPI003CCDD7A5